jgi:hypothetical protein
MIDLGRTDFLIVVPSLPRSQFEEYSTQLFDAWESRVGESLALTDYSLGLEVEEGSIKGSGKVLAYAGVLYLAIGNYGDFISGLQTIRSQVGAVGDYLAERAAVFADSGNRETIVRKRSGTLGQLQRLFVKVQAREMTVEQAMLEAEALLGEDATTSPEFMHALKESLAKAPLHPEQLSLVLKDLTLGNTVTESTKDRRRGPNKPKPVVPPSQQLRVEVWRESKKGQKKVRVIEL